MNRDTLASAANVEVGGTARAQPSVSRLLAGMMVATDLSKSRRFYEQFLGLECVRCAPGRLLARDRNTAAAMAAKGDNVFVLDIREVETIENPQRMLHHWGFSVGSAEEVDRVHAEAKLRKEEFEIAKLFPIANVHGAHNFYLADRDMNWWEVEYRLDGIDNEGFFARGDRFPEPLYSSPTGGLKPSAAVPPAMGPRRDAVLQDGMLSHGTCEQLVLERSRSFVEEVLQLRCVRHLDPAQVIAGRGSFGVFGIRLPRVKEQGPQNRWIVGMGGLDGVSEVCARARRSAESMGLRRVELAPDGLSCTIQDADGNWWEAVPEDATDYAALFARGDVDG